MPLLSTHAGTDRRGRRALLAATALAFACALGAPRPAGASWPSSPVVNVPVCTAGGSQAFRNAVTDGAGGILIAWVDTRSDSADLYIQRVDASGDVRWATNGALVCGGWRDQDSPYLASDGVGGAIVVWRDFRSGAAGDIYAQHIGPNGQRLWATSGIAVCALASEQANPVAVSDGFGGALVVWEDWRSGVATYGQRLDAGGVPRWAPGGIRLSNASAAQFEPEAISDGDHGVIVAWIQQAAGGFDVFVQHVSMFGDLWWGAGATPVVTEAGDQLRPVLASDGSGGALLAWEDRRSGGISKIYAQRVNTWGGAMFTPGGVRLCDAAGDQLAATLASDGFGGAIVAWHDLRAGDDIYAQRVNGSGTTLWGANARGVCTAGGAQQFPSARSDGNGGAIIAWEDFRGSAGDIYAQRVGPTGNGLWMGSGLPVSTAAGNQYQPVVVGDTDSLGVVAWVDQRTGGSDLYVQRVPFAITLAAPPSEAPEGLALAAPRPNPTHGEAVLGFTLPRAGRVTLAVHDAAGRRVRTLLDGVAPAGAQTPTWDGRDGRGRPVEPGAYFVRLFACGRTLSVRLVRLPR